MQKEPYCNVRRAILQRKRADITIYCCPVNIRLSDSNRRKYKRQKQKTSTVGTCFETTREGNPPLQQAEGAPFHNYLSRQNT